MAKGGKKSRSPSKKPKDGDSDEVKKVRSSSKSPNPKDENSNGVSGTTTKDAKKTRSSSKPPNNGTLSVSATANNHATEENVKVAVRVRSFNKREIDMKAKLIIDMGGGQTVIHNPAEPNQEGKKFAFDYSYWSFDGGKQRSDGFWEPDLSHPHGKDYCDQNKIFEDLGKGMLSNAWDGYNSTLFAYGQTGSGKSYSVVGYGPNKGIVPMFCEQLFGEIETKKAGGNAAYEVTFSMLEIYNEIVRDLLNPNCDKKKGLRIRQHPKKGFWPEQLTVVPVDSYQAINDKMNQGSTTRTIAATNMNATSSRAHTIVCITFVQKSKSSTGQELAKSSVINLVDLAGSERVSSTGATGDRLKEGAAINQSLSALGNVISALADQSDGKKVNVPYRDSVLTQLLMNALGGNSKTIMIAAISPADVNYEESLSTLRYADRAKQIKTRAIVNEDPTEKMIHELQDENARLKKMIKDGGGTIDDNEDYKKEMQENEREMEEMRKSFEEKLLLAQADAAASGTKTSAEVQKQRAKYPHLYNLNMDPQLNGMIVHIIKSGKYRIGNQKGSKSDIVMCGPSMLEQHAIIQSAKDHLKLTLEKAVDQARVLVNGKPITGQMQLRHNDRILFGTTQLYVYANPLEQKKNPTNYPSVTYEMAQEEIAEASGLKMNQGGALAQTDRAAQEKLIQVMPEVEDANSISEALNKMMKFEAMLVSPQTFGKPDGQWEVLIRVRNFANGLQYNWTADKFMERYAKMRELYEDVEDGDVKLSDVTVDKDPFIEPIKDPTLIGVAIVYLKSLAYFIPVKTQIAIKDLSGQDAGVLNITLTNCDASGKILDENSSAPWVDSTKSLIGKDLYFRFHITSAYGIPARFTDIYCTFNFLFGDQKEKKAVKTKKISGTSNPLFEHDELLCFKKIDAAALEVIENGRILVELWGVQVPTSRDDRDNRDTRAMLAADALNKGIVTQKMSGPDTRSSFEADVLRQRQQQIEAKLQYMREICKTGEARGMDTVPLSYIKGILDAPGVDTLNKWAKMYDYKGVNDGRPASANRINARSSTCVVS